MWLHRPMVIRTKTQPTESPRRWRRTPPLSARVFGSARMSVKHKPAFMRTLILSRLLFGIHVTIPSPRDIRDLSSVYMRVLRRICGQVRSGKEVVWTDLEVRSHLQQPSIDCLISRAGIRYAGRVARNSPRAVLALLHSLVLAVSPWRGLPFCWRTFVLYFPATSKAQPDWLTLWMTLGLGTL